MELNTKYGILKGVRRIETYQTGEVKECLLEEANEIPTEYGILIPIYEDATPRSKYMKSLSFYRSGAIKSINLQSQTEIDTPIGRQKVELVTFYESGKLNRIFQLNGKLSGFWGEEDEYALAKAVSIPIQGMEYTVKASGLRFYESGVLKNIVLWKNETLELPFQEKRIKIRYGVSFYEDGRLESLEPNIPYSVQTPFGKMHAYDNHPIGLHADKNSLKLNRDGSVRSLSTMSDKIIVDFHNIQKVFQPTYIRSLIDPEQKEVAGIYLSISDDSILIRDFDGQEYEYNRNEVKILIEKMKFRLEELCSNCASCSGCH